MILIIASLITGYIGLNIGGMIGGEIFMYLFGLVGVLSPALFVLEDIYREVRKSNNT
ncbi:hypothetical protein JHL18_15460 [Clostridium sp. YIM B02505]|uniref:Uncharacterized protein n=1 Tax=Clostridium yunnanense TaxID=2800325 RepID=A0ABS1ERK3_9CLOT|nr:hypothetical protein [Clostridium yunnanense]MBK1812019.1 hypothetical protein [Clostridium yunnanense]